MTRPERRIRAILGPTNTGKTHFAIDRMLGYQSGMIGFPLRLLARENYDRIVAREGARRVALITGEEKIVPPRPRWFVCTVESMPLDRPVDFIAIDEIQLCADADRGHVFTDRLLHARGLVETLFLGSDTMRPIIRSLVSGVEFDDRPRLSTLSYSGASNIARLPRRSAVVAFTVDRVYELAERVRRQRGGAAVVLGALSPRTRNAQVAMYQAGEVDYMVATDAIGMGLNMDVNHVAFAGLRKFDGHRVRPLAAVEVGQIAGRAGRHMNDGTFGSTARLGPFDPQLVEAVEDHRFEPVRQLYWRSRELDFASPKRLLQSLGRSPRETTLTRARKAEDQIALDMLARDADILDRAGDPGRVRLLWEVCQVPDFRKIMPDHHAAFLTQVFTHLTNGDGRLPVEWVRRQIDRLDDDTGDIDVLTGRIAHIRTWTYIAHRGDWLAESQAWQDRAGAIEDRLSDALHDRLTQRFVDRRAASIDRKREKGDQLLSAVTAAGDLVVEGQTVGRMDGIRFIADVDSTFEGRAILAAARRAALQDIGRRIQRLEGDPNSAFQLDDDGKLFWHGARIAQLLPGEDILAPRIDVSRSDLIDNGLRERIRARLAEWLKQHLNRTFRPLYRARAESLRGPARGLVFQLSETLGALPEPLPKAKFHELEKADRQRLSRLGLRLGPDGVFFDRMLRGPALALRATLWSVHTGRTAKARATPPAHSLAAGNLSKRDWACLGYRRIGTRAIRFDRVARLGRAARRCARRGPFVATPELTALAGVEGADFEQVMAGLGFRSRHDGEKTVFRRKYPPRIKRKPRDDANVDPHSPFATLRDVVAAK